MNIEKSNTQTWAEREVEIACEKEKANSEDNDFEYGCACYKSALKAYQSLMEDGHTGFSIGLTKDILIRLMEDKPLTPIEDTDDVWDDISNISVRAHDIKAVYQCNRMGSLFKNVYVDGTVKYSDSNSVYCVDINNPNCTYRSGLVQRIVDEMFPITMPYFPGEAYAIFREDFLTDRNNGDFDTVGIFYAVKPDGEKVEINRFFKESKEGFIEIDADEYDERKKMSKLLLEAKGDENVET